VPAAALAPERLFRRPVFIVAVFGFALLAGVLGAVLSGSSRQAGGDPNGTGLRILERVRAAVPSGATDVTKLQVQPSEWFDGGGCPGGGGEQRGWGNEAVSTTFKDSAQRGTVIEEINGALARLGWKSHDLPDKPAGWMVKMPPGNVAYAFAFKVPAAGSVWFFSAEWQPPGPKGWGCP
jgi:hypothetical protein